MELERLFINRYTYLFIFLMYLFFMVIKPFFELGYEGLISTLKSWQTLNAGIIALFAAYISISHSKWLAGNAETVRKKEKQAMVLARLHLMRIFFKQVKNNLTEMTNVYVNLKPYDSAIIEDDLKIRNRYFDQLKTLNYKQLNSLTKDEQDNFYCIFENSPQSAQEHLSELIVNYDVLISRYNSLREDIQDSYFKNKANLHNAVYEIAISYTKIDQYYEIKLYEDINLKLTKSVALEGLINSFHNLSNAFDDENNQYAKEFLVYASERINHDCG